MPEAVAEVEQEVLVAVVILFPNGYEIVGEYPDASWPASPEHDDTGNGGLVTVEPAGMPFQLKPGEF